MPLHDTKKCEYCGNYVGITNDLDYPTHLDECPKSPDNLLCRNDNSRACKSLLLTLRIPSDESVYMKTVCGKQGCFKSFATTEVSWWETAVPEPETDL